MICPKCGATIKGGYRYVTCPNCGRTYDSNQLENEYDTLKTETWDLDLKEILGYEKRKVCSNCKNEYIEGDRYCRYCGAPMGKPDYIDYDVPVIYGPLPTERLHTCEQCGFKWKTYSMLDKERFCPECGGAAPAVVVSRSKDEDSIPISLESTSENGDSDDHKTTNPILDIVRIILAVGVFILLIHTLFFT